MKSGRPKRANETEVAGVRVTNPDRVLYPDTKLTKLGLIRYYEQVADRMLPHVSHRPLSLFRCPEGRGGACFYQKHVESGMPAAVGGVEIREGRGTRRRYPIVENLAGLVALVQMGVLEIHLWGARDDDVERPDRIVFDLDPAAGLGWDRVTNAAVLVRAKLEALGLESWVKTTGGKGIHVVVPVARRHDWDTVHEFSRAVAGSLVRAYPADFTINPLKVRRKGRIFIDYLRNARGATAVAPYSSRAREGAPVSAPISWEELSRGAKGADFTVTTVPARIRKQRHDPWAALADCRQKISAAAFVMVLAP
jgi:bifunctional non-homologous end joining protein LigD